MSLLAVAPASTVSDLIKELFLDASLAAAVSLDSKIYPCYTKISPILSRSVYSLFNEMLVPFYED
ncbi:hypothetical protein PVAP13_5NG121500 [Panicum virgatum]|uniref:Uncharacterized protein n=1 Tax=Panicum virgatum TaxID=38727 RepID=A0A8T0RQP3_PANVG|nr:hypothetical protein PVAP13_5NG121500 [Panicum virgatum]KAG2587159.1 hypothetical protein PVAP13_5NG121500 [Panicum virgatum]